MFSEAGCRIDADEWWFFRRDGLPERPLPKRQIEAQRPTRSLFITFRRGDRCLQAGEEAPPPFEFLLNRFVSFPADAASCS